MTHQTIHIGDISDPRLDVYRDLRQSDASPRDPQRFIVEGWLLLERLLGSRFPVESIVTTESAAARVVALTDSQTPIFRLDKNTIRQLIGFDFHRGTLACARRLPTLALDDIVTVADQRLTLVLLPQIRDPANLGGILRNCAAFGVDAVILGTKCTDYLGRRTLRVSMGAALNLAIIHMDSMSLAIERLQREFFFQVAATTTDVDANSLESFRREARLALVFGPEDTGLSSKMVKNCNCRLSIPIADTIDSLNVAVASGIILHRLGNSLVR